MTDEEYDMLYDMLSDLANAIAACDDGRTPEVSEYLNDFEAIQAAFFREPLARLYQAKS